MTKLLVLGFYDRNNMGDDTYKLALPRLLPDCEMIFRSMDDIQELPIDIDAVICGGGDIINEYFMDKARRLLKNCLKPVYALSVGIPYASCARYLNLFDHVFARSTGDAAIASQELGTENVTQIADAVLALPIPWLKTQSTKTRVGICLAQPMFYGRFDLVDALVEGLAMFAQTHSNIEYHLLAFNYSNNVHESDHVVNTLVRDKLQQNHAIIAQEHRELTDPIAMLQFIKQNIDLIFGSRFHSIIFALLTHTPFATMYVSHKIDCLLADIQCDPTVVIRLDTDIQDMPVSIDATRVAYVLNAAIVSMPNEYAWQGDLSPLTEKKLRSVLIKKKLDDFNNVLDKCRQGLSDYFNWTPRYYDSILHIQKTLKTDEDSALNVARMICFLISGMLNHPCVWGLASNMRKPEFCLFDAIDYIWHQCYDLNAQIAPEYYTKLPNLKRKVTVNMDFAFQNDFSSYHRAGWSYVIGGMMNLDGPVFLKEGGIMIDTYVDRSFHWGLDTLTHMKILPYTKPWIGFVHHTFDETHSIYNCVELFKKQVFLESLKTCTGIIVLSDYLAKQMRQALKNAHFETPVHTLYHPTEFVDNMFDIEQLKEDYKIVQIGAWLRNPYAIYELPIKNHKKAALRGKEMEQYFAPPRFLNVIEDALFATHWFENNDANMCHAICRDPQIVSKFCEGYYNMTCRQLDSVQVIERLSNDDYDELLTKNVVFLNLVDCSAVNTVIECIVRNTPLIVNRHPALEEVLGINYPGFYTTLEEAARLCDDINSIKKIHNYMTFIDKTRYKIEQFIKDFQDIILGQGVQSTYNVLMKYEPFINLYIYKTKYINLIRYLPLRWNI